MLHIFSGEGGDYIIAENAEDAAALYFETTGSEPEDDGEFSQWPDDKPFTVSDEDDPTRRTRLPAEWCAELGRCYFGADA